MSAKKISMRCRIVELEGEVSRLRMEKEEIEDGVEQMRAMYDAAVMTLVLHNGWAVHGKDGEPDGKGAYCPKFDVAKTLGDYEMSVVQRADGAHEIIVRPKEKEERDG